MSTIDLSEHGIKAAGERMDNGESRFRFVHPDGTAYIRTEAGAVGAWQNAHFHKGVRETYIVQSGWMAFATSVPDDNDRVDVYYAGEVVNSAPNVAHNVYLPAGAVIHTVKHGQVVGNPEKGGNDWWPADTAFDEWTKGLSESGIRFMD